MDKILIIAFKFPPMGGIGTRRWAKFSKYLSRRGVEVHVLTTDYKYRDKVNWTKDIEENITIHRVKSGCPDFMLKASKSFIDKVLNRLLKPFVYRMYPFDIAQRWDKYMIPEANRIIKEYGIKNFVVTGPPSSVQYLGAIIRVENPEANYIIDYRDPWNTDRDFAYNTLGLFNKSKSIEWEKSSLQIADKIIFNTQELKNQLSTLFDIDTSKSVVINNGYDMEDYNENKSISTGFNIIYTGGLGKDEMGRKSAIPAIARGLEELNDDTLNDIKISIYSDLSQSDFASNKYYKRIKQHFTFNGFVSPDEIPNLILNHKYCLSINDPRDKHAIGTKVFDYMALDKKIFHISDGGELYNILAEENNIVSKYDMDSIKKSLLELKEDYLSGKEYKNPFTDYDIDKLTTKVMELLV